MLGAPTTDGKKRKTRGWSSKVTLTHPAPTLFTGRVSSRLAACRAARLVNLYYTDPGTGETSLLSVQRTNKKGSYRVDLVSPAYAGSYQAIVIGERIKALQRPQKCRGAKGGRLTVE